MSDDARDRILTSAMALRLKQRDGSVTVEAVAKGAGCAKGLVAYHFKTKKALFQEADLRIAAERRATWVQAMDRTNPQTAIDACWQVITKEATSGVAVHAGSVLTDWSDNEGFAAAVGLAAVRLLGRAGRTPTVAEPEVVDLCGVTLPGFAHALASGADPRRLEGAYAAFWAALFALTRAR